MTGFNLMAPFYASMTVVPLLMWVIAVISPVPGLSWLRLDLAVLVGIGSVAFGVIGFREVFVHGKR